MKLSQSFRMRLFAGFLLASLLPLLLCAVMLLQVFRLRLDSQMDSETQGQLSSVTGALDSLYEGFRKVSLALQSSPYVSPALATGQRESDMVYSELYGATEGSRSSARFDLYDAEGNWLYSTGSAAPQGRLPTQWGVLRSARESGKLVFSQVDGGEGSGAVLLQGCAYLTTPEGAGAGYLVITLTRSHIAQALEGKYGNRSQLLLLSRYWRPVYATQTGQAETLAAQLRQRLLAGEPLSAEGGEFAYRLAFQEGMGLYVVLQRPQALNQDTRRLLTTVTAGSELVCLVLSVLMSISLSRQMFRPVARLQKAIGEVERNNLDVYVTHYQNDELGQLAQRFNEMLVALKRNQEQLVENQKELNEAQIRMLQAQLNPHFLCNTLDTMKWISKINKVPQVAVMSTNLADILRFCVSPDEFVPLRQELEILNRYVEIQRIRLSGTFTFRPLVPLELEACLVPKMMLQPIVENAILHGLDGVENGVAEIRAWARDGVLTIRVTDNGRGFPPELEGPYARRDRELSRGHLGLYNVDTILQKYYGQGFGLFLENCPDGAGAAVTATLPLRYEEEEPIPC